MVLLICSVNRRLLSIEGSVWWEGMESINGSVESICLYQWSNGSVYCGSVGWLRGMCLNIGSANLPVYHWFSRATVATCQINAGRDLRVGKTHFPHSIKRFW